MSYLYIHYIHFHLITILFFISDRIAKSPFQLFRIVVWLISLLSGSELNDDLLSISIPLLQSEEGCPKGGVVGEKGIPYSSYL